MMFVDVPGRLPHPRRHYESFNSSIGVEGLQPPVAPQGNRNIDPRSGPRIEMRSPTIRLQTMTLDGRDSFLQV
jgi:hypothetical protein